MYESTGQHDGYSDRQVGLYKYLVDCFYRPLFTEKKKLKDIFALW
jgi:hypothetical protein